MKIHDEHIDDSMYSVGWREVSTSNGCKNKKCRCNGSGSCKFAIFNHFMYRVDDENTGRKTDQFDFPLLIGSAATNEFSVEEIKCARYTVGAAYNYYVRRVMLDSSETMVSVFLGDYKSSCFNMLCFVLEMPRSLTSPGYLCLDSSTPGHTNVVARECETSASILEEICLLGLDPIVAPGGNCTLGVFDENDEDGTVQVSMLGFRYTAGAKTNVVGPLDCKPDYPTVKANPLGVRAVRTALATVSVVLTPKSLYGGKNPTTKLVSYFVHNVTIR